MRAKFTRQSSDERGVSPVIGVILMVAITVILAAVIGFFVLGLGSDQASAPQASFSFDDTNDQLTMNSGDDLNGNNLKVLVGSASSTPFGSDVTAGTTVGVTAGPGDTVKVIWTAPSGGQSSTIWQTTV